MEGSTKRLPLSRGLFAVVDEADYERVSQFNWFADATGYGARDVEVDGKKTRILLHRFLMDAPATMEVDHIDGDKQNNTRANLRLCTHQQNQRNIRKVTPHSSRFKGVHFYKRDQRWQAYIKADGRRVSLGYFDTEEEAARSYDAAAQHFFGEFANLNFPDEEPAAYVPAYQGRRVKFKCLSRYRGVFREAETHSWKVRIKAGERTTVLSGFETEEAAARAYDDLARQHHGTKAKLNF